MEFNDIRDYDLIDFVHMKLHAQNWVDTSEKWQEKVDWYFTDGLKIGNANSMAFFHYAEKDFCDKIHTAYEECIG